MRKSVVASLPDRPDKRKYALEVVYHASKAFSMSLFILFLYFSFNYLIDIFSLVLTNYPIIFMI